MYVLGPNSEDRRGNRADPTSLSNVGAAPYI